MIFFKKNDIQFHFPYFIRFLKFIVLGFFLLFSTVFCLCCCTLKYLGLGFDAGEQFQFRAYLLFRSCCADGQCLFTGQAERKSRELSLTWKFAQGSNHS